MAVILLILVIFIYSTKTDSINKLKKEIQELKEENQLLKSKIFPDGGYNIEKQDVVVKKEMVQNNDKIEYAKETHTDKNIKLEKEYVQPKKTKEKIKSEKERKTTTMFATGATFIILDAIVLITSTWSLMPNIVKTIMLMLIAGIFFALSSFAKKKNLHKAHKAFYYIAMAYIPIFCISISTFGLLGEYLSIFGEGKFIYFTLAGIANSILYYIEYKRKNMPGLFYGSILIQVLTVVVFSCIFETNIQKIVLCMLLYNIGFMALTDKNKIIKDNKYIYSVIPYFGLVFGIFSMFIVNSYIVLCDLILTAVNFLVLYFKNKSSDDFVIFNTVINIIGFYFVWKINSALKIELKSIITILYLIIANCCIIEINKNKGMKNTAIIQLLLSLQIVFFMNISSNMNRFIIALIQLLISIYSYIKLKADSKSSTIINMLIFIYAIISQILLSFVLKISSYQWFVFSSIFTFCVYEVIDQYIVKRENLKIWNFYMSHVYLAIVTLLTLICNLENFSNDIFDWIIITLIYIYSMYKFRGNSIATICKYLSYITTGITLNSICNCVGIQNNVKLVIPSIITVLFLFVEPKLSIKSEMDNIFEILLYIVSYLCISCIQGIGSVIIAIALTAIISMINYLKEKNKSMDVFVKQIVSVIGFIIVGLITFSQENINPFALQIIYLSISLGTSLCAIFKYKKELFAITSGIYLIMAVVSVGNKYFGTIIFLIWNIYNYFIIFKDTNYKKIFKIAIYIDLLTLYNIIIGDLNFDKYATIRLFGYLVCSIAISNIIQEKFDILLKEIVVTLINIYALTIYINNFDGMLFTLVLVYIVIYSYYNKSGNLFIVATVNIILNIFALTRKFWFSVPWWIYLLVVGCVLISFAVKNEANENKSKSKGLIDNIISIKEKIDKGK